ncbi:hypothetical protein MKX29_24240 [Cytobacillus sp. FSL R7-0696]|uniref:hypothetical protein n=1 Tax=Cytobacillus sp. FSL R7-0696 TaxID=2921691 RepID=UPI0030F52F6B
MKAQREYQYDEYERQASFALMRENAHRTKRPKLSDIYKRPPENHDEAGFTRKVEEAQHTADWLSQFQFVEREEAK